MKITFSPTRHQDQLTVSVIRDAITLNGEVFDFAPLPEGATLPASAVKSDWITGPVMRQNGEIEIMIALPHGVKAPRETLFPDQVQVKTDGPVALPPYEVSQ